MVGAMTADEGERERLTYDEVDLVLRRATELQHGDPSGEGTFSLGEVERLGGEIGLSPDAVRTALVQVRSGALVATEATSPTLADRLLGPVQVVVQRRVRGPRDEVWARLSESMREQLFRVKRNFGERVQWERSEGIFSQVRRALDIGDRYTLRDAEEIETAVMDLPGDGGDVEVVLVARFPDTRRQQLQGTLIGAGVLTTAGLVGAGFLFPILAMAGIASIVGGVGVGALAISAGRHTYRKKTEHARDGLERMLDALEHER